MTFEQSNISLGKDGSTSSSFRCLVSRARRPMVVVELGSCCVSMGCLPRHFSWELLWQRLTVPKMADAGRQTDVGPADAMI